MTFDDRTEAGRKLARGVAPVLEPPCVVAGRHPPRLRGGRRPDQLLFLRRGVMTVPTARVAPAIFVTIVAALLCWRVSASTDAATPILVYHRFGSVASHEMTVRTWVFESQLETMAKHGYTVIPLRTLVSYFRGMGPPPPSRAIVLTVDDGHRSVYTDMLPVVLRRGVSVTLFVYPSAVSSAAYALTWEQLRELRATGLVDIQSHTYWHPHFLQEKRRLSVQAYEHLVNDQLVRSRSILEERLGTTVDLLSWPFGFHDDDLRRHAVRAGYIAAVALERRHATMRDPIMALPRYIVTDGDQGSRFEALLKGRSSSASADINQAAE